MSVVFPVAKDQNPRGVGWVRRDPGKVSPWVAVAGVVVGLLLPPPVPEPCRGWDIIWVVREPSWMERCSPSMWSRWPPSPVGDLRRAGGGGQTWPTGTPPPPGGWKDAAARAWIGEDSTLPPPGWSIGRSRRAMHFCGRIRGAAERFLFVTALGKEVTWLAGSEMLSNLTP